MDRSFEVVETSSALDSTGVDPSILRANLRGFSVFPLLHKVLHTFVGKVFIEPLVVYLDHWRIHTSTQALHLLQSKQTVL